MTFVQSLLWFLSSWMFIVLFYIVIALIVYINRKKFQVEGGVIFLYKTKWGMKFIDKVAGKYKEFIKIIGYSAIGIGFVGMIAICGVLIDGLYNLIFVPAAPATLSLVIPGVQIPGSAVFVPFWYGIIALFVVIVVHEFGHGIVAKANGINIKSTGVGLMAIIPLAFVEPDEKQVVKRDSVVQQSIFASGPFFNGLLCIVILLLIMLVNAAAVSMTQSQGFQFTSFQHGYAAEKYGLMANTTYNNVNGIEINTTDDLTKIMSTVKPNDTLIIGNSTQNVTIIASESPSNPSKGYLGIGGVSSDYKLKSKGGFYTFIFDILMLLSNPFASGLADYTLLQWIYVLSLGIGLANLLPLGPVDGGRMINKALIDTAGKNKGIKVWIVISFIVLITMLILVFVPIIKNVFFKI